MTFAALVAGLVAVERCGELLYAARNTRRLCAAGASEYGAAHYPLILVLHAAWLVAIVGSASAADPLWPLLAMFLLLQVLRFWVIASLGRYWTTRIISMPGQPLVKKGPYRFLRHPNYAIVIAEIAVLPLAFREVAVALVFSGLNLALLAWRIRIEDMALASRA